jgi:AcrR family transcriptional regulator
MSPAPVKASNAAILAAARAIVASEGEEGLSLNAVADAVGVRAPSLYKRFANRAALVEEVRESVLADVASIMRDARGRKRGAVAIRAMASAFRSWAKAEPRLYHLIYASPPSGLSPAAQAALVPVLEDMTALAGERRALSAARLFMAFLRGFVSLENEGQFNMGGSVDEAFNFGVDTILKGLRPQ